MRGLICAIQFLSLLFLYTQSVVFNMCANFTLGKDTEGMSGFFYKRGSVKNVEDFQAEVCHSCLCLLPCSIC